MRFHKNLYEQIQYDTAQSVAVADPPERKGLLLPLIWCAVPGALLVLFRLLRHNRAVMDKIVFGFTTPLKHLLGRMNGHLPFAVGELVWGLALLALAVFLVRTVYLLIKGPDRGMRLLRRGLVLLGAGLVVYCCYTLMWGCNYYAAPFTQRANLSQRGCTEEELAVLTAAFADKCTQLAPQVERTGYGTMDMEGIDLFTGSALLYGGIEQEFPALAVERHDPKPMFFSRVMSLTGFSGFYFPMTAESIVNVDQADCMIPSTILHELAHQCNVAEEDAANFVAILAGLRCDNPRFQYSSALLGYIHLSNALCKANPDLYQAVKGRLNDQVLVDLEANDRYWKQFETPVADASEKVYNGFLNSYGHSEGMKSYGMCVNLLSAYYYGGENPRIQLPAQETQEQSEEQAQAPDSATESNPKSGEGETTPSETKKTSSETEKASEKDKSGEKSSGKDSKSAEKSSAKTKSSKKSTSKTKSNKKSSSKSKSSSKKSTSKSKKKK